jgi:hypothetical protein
MRAVKVTAAVAALAAVIAVASSAGLIKSVAEQDSFDGQHTAVLASAQPGDWHWFDE